MTPYEMGKYAALMEYGLEKDAAMPAFLGAIGRGMKGLGSSIAKIFRGKPGVPAAVAGPPKVSPGGMLNTKKPIDYAAYGPGAKTEAQAAAAKHVTPDKMIGQGEVRPPMGEMGTEAYRQQRMADATAAFGGAGGEAGEAASKGLWGSIPWWGKGIGLAGAGYGAYKLLGPKGQQEPQGMQPYFGPGNAAVDPRMMYPGY